MRAVISIHARQSVEHVNANAIILLCQDRLRQCFVLAGERGALQELLVWGARNWQIMPPGEQYVRAVTEVLGPLVRAKDRERVLRVSDGLRHGPGPKESSMDFEIRVPPVTMAFNDMTDALFFAIDEHGVKVRASGGSSMQKQGLLETGIAVLFGDDVLERFLELLYADVPPAVRTMAEEMRKKMRESPDEEVFLTDSAADALRDKGPKN
jgi:hypothetical protein